MEVCLNTTWAIPGKELFMLESLVRLLSACLRPAFTLFSRAGFVVDWIDVPGALVLLTVQIVDEMERTPAW
jgi:hypothetical protein